MADVKWIKITTDMFDNRKIKHLRRLPDGNSVVLIWVMLLTMAGRCNSGGRIFLTETIPYNPKMLADELDFEENTVQLALTSLEQLNMVVMQDGFLTVPGWEEYQNIEGMEKIRESKRLSQARWRAKQKELQAASTVDSTVVSTEIESGNADIDKERDLEREKEEEGEVIDISPEANASATVPPPPKEKPVKPKGKHKHGEYKNVLLTDEELEKLKGEFPDYEERIERLSSYVASTGKSYKSHYATIRHWAKNDQGKAQKQSSYQNKQSAQGNVFLEMLEDDLY